MVIENSSEIDEHREFAALPLSPGGSLVSNDSCESVSSLIFDFDSSNSVEVYFGTCLYCKSVYTQSSLRTEETSRHKFCSGECYLTMLVRTQHKHR